MRGGTPILVLWTVTWRNCTPLDGVHPQSREGQTDSATVQGHLVHPSVWAPGETNKVNDISCRVLMMQYFTIATMAYDRGISGHKPSFSFNLKPTDESGLSLFFLLLAARVRSSCEEGPGQSALQSA